MQPSGARTRRDVDAEHARPAIGPAGPEDVPALLALEQAAFAGDRLSRRSLARLVRLPTCRFVVARSNGALAGYAIVLLHRRRRAARIYSLAVAAEFSGQGLGGALVEAACEAARRAGRRAISLEVRADNPRAIALYGRHGFAETGTVADYYEDGEGAIRMTRKLDHRDEAEP